MTCFAFHDGGSHQHVDNLDMLIRKYKQRDTLPISSNTMTTITSFSKPPNPPEDITNKQTNDKAAATTTTTNEPNLYMPTKLLPPSENLVANSTQRLSRLEIQQAITDIKRFVEARLESDLHVVRVSSICCTTTIPARIRFS